MNRFKELLTQCPHHGLNKENLCQIVCEGLDVSTRANVESMSRGEFLCKNVNEG